MYEYEFVKVQLINKALGYSIEPKNDYKEIIKSYAKEGWRLFQIFSPSIYSSHSSEFIELIFEKEVKEES